MRPLRNLVVLVVLLLAVDHAARLFVAEQVEARLASELSVRQLQLEIGGFPFLWNLAKGELTSVTISAEEIAARVRVSDVRVTLNRVVFSLAEVVSGDFQRTRTEGGRGTARMSVTVVQDALDRAGHGDVAVDRLPGVKVAGQTMSVGPVDLELPVLISGMSYDSARLVNGALVLRFRVDRGVLAPASTRSASTGPVSCAGEPRPQRVPCPTSIA